MLFDGGDASSQGRVEVTGLLSALIGFASAHFAAAGWVPLRTLELQRASSDASAEAAAAAADDASDTADDASCRRRHRMTVAEVALVRQTEALIVDLVGL